MKTFNKIALSFFVFIAALMLIFAWTRWVEFFPAFPTPLARFLVDLYGAKDAEQIADLEIIVGLVVSVLVMGLVAFLAIILWRIYKRRHGTGEGR